MMVVRLTQLLEFSFSSCCAASSWFTTMHPEVTMAASICFMTAR